MELEHSFTVPVPKNRAWDVLLDVERVAPCMPGATLDSVDGDEIHGRIKVKVGPINMMYAGTARFIEKDAEAGVVTLEASGKETKGAGTAAASVRSTLEDRGHETHVTVLTTLSVTGKPAQFGRGVMNEVGGKLLTIFAANLAAALAQDEAGAAGRGNGAAGTPPAAAHAGSAAQANGAVADTGRSQADTGRSQADTAQGQADAALSASVDDLKLPPRAVSSLHREGIATVGALAARTEDNLLAIDGIGPASVADIKAKLADRGLSLGTAATASAPAAAGHAHPATAREAAHQLEDDAINLLKVAGMPVLKRALPVLAGLTAVLLLALRRRVRRRHG
ncbi:MAG TPA: SRPBCC domain-containing protein [Streptosporangiaceae bacterium]|nr:SRPBCC domain-containing protein [Streptosporangiaceae bacterium]